jgi:hypothetical protein
MKQSAVEWLVNEYELYYSGESKLLYCEMIEQALKMEKQQMIEMHDKGFDSVEQLNDEFAIEFTEWLLKKHDGVKSVKEQLEIYKKEKGL